MFKRIKGALAGGASVDAVLDSPSTTPGGVITGRVDVVGGSVDQEVNKIELALAVVAEVETNDGEHKRNVEFGRVRIREGFTMRAGVSESVRFSLPVPAEMPFNVLRGQSLRGVSLGVRTELDIARAIDKGDHDPVSVHALPIQERVVAAVEAAGFRFHSADLEVGRLPGSSLPVYQELEFRPSGDWARALNELELTFVTSPAGVEVLLEGDRKGGLLSGGADRLVRVQLSHQGHDVESAIRDGLRRLGSSRNFLFG